MMSVGEERSDAFRTFHRNVAAHSFGAMPCVVRHTLLEPFVSEAGFL